MERISPGEKLKILNLAVFHQEVCHVLSDSPDLFNGRQKDNTEMVRRLPIESCSLHHQYFLCQEKIEEKLLVIVDFVFLHINFREEVERAHWLDAGNARYGLKGLIGAALRCSYSLPPGEINWIRLW